MLHCLNPRWIYGFHPGRSRRGKTPVTGVIPEQQLRSLLAVHGSWFLNKHLFISDWAGELLCYLERSSVLVATGFRDFVFAVAQKKKRKKCCIYERFREPWVREFLNQLQNYNLQHVHGSSYNFMKWWWWWWLLLRIISMFSTTSSDMCSRPGEMRYQSW